MWILRAIPFALPQLLLLLFMLGKFDLLGGFNRTDAGMNTVMALFVLAPVAAALWFLSESVAAVVEALRKKQRVAFLVPAIALGTRLEALGVGAYLLSQAKL